MKIYNRCTRNVKIKDLSFIVTISSFKYKFINTAKRKKYYLNYKFSIQLFISYCSTVHFRRITSIYQPTNARIISNKTQLKHFKTLQHVSILSDHHQGALFLAKVILQYSQLNSYLQTRCCGSISCCVGMCYGAVARCASYNAHLATAP